jgi:hypothetical protein
MTGSATFGELARLDVARIERLRNEPDAWRLLNELSAERRWGSRVAAHARVMAHYSDFIALVVPYPAADIDALLHTARAVFSVTVRVMRADLERARAMQPKATAC